MNCGAAERYLRISTGQVKVQGNNNMQTPHVSIIMPAYASAQQISTSIQSVVGQSYADWELIVVDDCSPDDTAEVVTEWAERDPRIRLVRMPENSGPAGARNAGIKEARGRYIAFIDSDDVWLPRKLEVQIAAMEAQDAAFSCTAYEVFKGHETIRTVQVPTPIRLRRMLRGSVIGCLTVMYDTHAIGKRLFPDLDGLIAGTSYAERLRRVRHEDYALWLDILSLRSTQGDPVVCIGIPVVLARYNDGSGSFSSDKSSAALSQWIIYRRHMRLNPMTAAYNFACYAIAGVIRRL